MFLNSEQTRQLFTAPTGLVVAVKLRNVIAGLYPSINIHRNMITIGRLLINNAKLLKFCISMATTAY